MTRTLLFVVIGLGPGAVYALATLGVIAIYRGSGVINFAQGGLALVGASTFMRLRVVDGWPTAAAMVVAVAAAALVGGLLGLVVSRLLRAAAPVMQVVATLGFLSILQEVNFLVFGTPTLQAPAFLPAGSFHLSSVPVRYSVLTLLALAVVLTVLLHLLHTRTAFGRATAATAEDTRVAASLGCSPARIAVANWALGGALGGLAGVLIVPISGYSPGSLTILVLPAFAAALIGGFDSLALGLVGAVCLGVAQSVITDRVSASVVGASDALPFVLIVLILLVRTRALPQRAELSARLPRLSPRVPSVASVAAVGVAGLVLVLVTSGGLRTALVTMFVGVIALLSIVVLVGYAGQISLGNFALAGVAALVAGRLSQAQGWPFLAAGIVGVLAAAAAGLVFGIPAVRARGVSLAIVTLGLGVAVSDMLFANPDLTGGFGGTLPRPPHLFGLDVSGSEAYGVVVVVVGTAIAFLLRNVRAGRIGRRMYAIRSNERAALALGINVPFVKLYSFVLSAAIAGVAGVLFAFGVTAIDYSRFDYTHSLTLVSSTLIGGAGALAGAVIGAPSLPDGPLSYWFRGYNSFPDWLLLIGGVLLVVTLATNTDGIAYTFAHLRPRRKRPEGAAAADVTSLRPGAARRRETAVLTAEDITVRFGQVVAVNAVSLAVRSGRITSILGANGAGKTTLIDALSGYVTLAAGTVRLGGTELTRKRPHLRRRAGLTRSFQSVELFEDLRVVDNIRLAAEDAGRSLWVRDLLPRRDRGTPPEVSAVADRLRLTPYLDLFPSELPHGVRSLVGVARAVATGATTVLLDEPAAGLDEAETRQLAATLRYLADELNIGILLVEHHVGLVSMVSDEVVVMDFGRCIFRGSPTDALADSEVVRAYLGAPAA